MYYLRILTGFELQDGSIDSIDIKFETLEEAYKYAEVAIEHRYIFEISKV